MKQHSVCVEKLLFREKLDKLSVDKYILVLNVDQNDENRVNLKFEASEEPIELN